MDTNAFYQTVATFSFTLLGLWWGVLQLRHAEWVDDAARRRMAYSVHLAFLVPGVMSLGALTAGDIKVIWRLVFVVAGTLGIVATVALMRAMPVAAESGWFARYGRWATVVVYAVIVLLAALPGLAPRLAPVQPLQIEGLMFALLVFLGAGLAWDFLASPKRE
jgi:hypothetical protein